MAMGGVADVRDAVERLVQRAERPPGYVLPDPIENAALVAFEQRTRLSVPSSLAQWLARHNGALVGPGGIFGIASDDEFLDIESVRALLQWDETWWLPVAGDGVGNYYGMGTATSAEPEDLVFFVDTHEDPLRPAYAVASDMWHFLFGLLSGDGDNAWWPFDRDRTLDADPQLAQQRVVALPWEA